MADKTEYREHLVQEQAIPAPDDLIAGTDIKADGIKLIETGDFVRGQLMMSSEDGFISATSEGVTSKELCILCDNVSVPADSYIESAGYFRGTFNGAAIVVPYESESDDHNETLETLKPLLRKQGIFVV